jgi:hypothetical protein|tara:strand:+ start:391 stop:972 length:582 start_codon:yes stop_codon:yes gene_type:complete
MSVSYNQAALNKERKDKFIMVIPTPKFLKDDVNKFVRDNKQVNPDSVQFSIYGSVVPPVQIPNVETRYSGQTLNVTSHNRPPYPPVNVKFTIDNRFENYWFIYKWMDKLQDDYAGYFNKEKNYPKGKVIEDEYMADFTIYALDEYNKKVAQFDYTKGFPTFLGGIEYSYRDPSEIETQFSFAYSQFYVKLLEP